MEYRNIVKKKIEETGTVYVLIGAKLQIWKRERKLTSNDWNRITDNLSTEILGVFSSEKEARENFLHNIRKFGSGATSFLEFKTARIICVDDIDEIDLCCDGSEFLGIEELEEICKKW